MSLTIKPNGTKIAGEELLHDVFFNLLRNSEYSYLDKENHIYLDYTGANIIPKRILDQHHNFLSQHVLGNPHSNNPTSDFSTKAVEKARREVLSFFNATNKYNCIFVNNASAAIQIIADFYPFGLNGRFLLTTDNHNSIHGIRECVNNVKYVSVDSKTLTINQAELELDLINAPDDVSKLFAYPAQSNSSGVKHSLEWIEKAKDLGWDVFLDAAAYVPSSRLDLSKYSPDFVSISFYKMFGYPAGIGCLLVLNDKVDLLERTWFAGGTVSKVTIAPPTHHWAIGHEKFENGTPNFTGVPAICYGLRFLNSIGMERISQRITSLANYFIERLLACEHENKHPLVKIFGSHVCADRSGTISLDILDETGGAFPFKLIEEFASHLKISIRAGRFCNYGVFEVNNPHCKKAKHFGAFEGSDELEVASGTIRVSVGLATTQVDIDSFIDFVNALKNKEYQKSTS